MKVKITTSLTRQVQMVVALLFLGCPPSTTRDGGLTVLPDGGVPASRSDVLRAAGLCSLNNATAFRSEAAAFKATPSPATWARAMTAWQRLEVMQFGPTASSTTPGGQDFRDQLYSWPLISRCAVDETLTTGAYVGGVSSLLINRRGLAAAEYLLHSAPDEATCGDLASWNQLTSMDRAARKPAYATLLAADVDARAGAFVTAWEPFVETLATAGPGNATFPTIQGAFNRVSDALFYLDTQMKDLKLAPAIGLRNCATPPCLDALESPFAHHDKANLRANLVGLRQLLQGCGADYSGVGFDDLLDAQAAFSLSARLITSVAAAMDTLEAIPQDDLRNALTTNPALVRALYDALKAITDLLKSEFITVLDIDLPMGLEGDND